MFRKNKHYILQLFPVHSSPLLTKIKGNFNKITAFPVFVCGSDKKKLDKMFFKATSLLGLWTQNNSGIMIEFSQGHPVALVGDLKTFDINRELILKSLPPQPIPELSSAFQNPVAIFQSMLNESYEHLPKFTDGIAALALMENM